MIEKETEDSENTKLIPCPNIKEKLLDYFNNKPQYLDRRSNTVSLYQTCIMIMTITAISAVDFKMFPTRFRKSKTFGLSLVITGAFYHF